MFLTALLIAIGLAMDAFAVSLGIGTARQAESSRAKFRLAFHFGFFQGGMTVVGWLLGSTIAGFISDFDHWLAMGLLAYVGVGMIRTGLNPDADGFLVDPSRGRILMVLCVATSIDAMAVGFSMAFLDTPLLSAAMLIGVVTYLLSMIGLAAGDRLGLKFGKKMEILGGLILIFIGIRIVVTHLLEAGKILS